MKPKSILKYSGGCGKRHCIYSRSDPGNKNYNSLPETGTKNQTLISETIPSKEPEFDWLVYRPVYSPGHC